jgi:3-deoxy-D-manno-octulosonic-acid transferase
MFRFVYNLALLLITLISLPKYLWEMIIKAKHRRSFLEKLGLKIPPISLPENGIRIWVHSISVGETKAVAPLVEKIRHQYPHASIVISTTSETGHAEAKRSMPGLDHYFYLPIDFSWAIKRLVKRIKPDLLILVESDFWYNLISYNQNVVLVNGKLSENSLARFKLVPFFTQRLFGHFKLLCVQSERYSRRFELLRVPKSKIVVTGNLKFDQPFPHIDKARWKKDLGIHEGEKVITLGSTHEPEEEMLLSVLEKFPEWKILLVPRHPERFDSVAQLLERKGYAFARFSDHRPKLGTEKIILVDAMGILSACYQLSNLAIVGGSYVSHVGGHNIFEPAALGVPVLFGPHMESQKDLVELVINAGAGKQVPFDELEENLKELTNFPSTSMHEAGLRLASEVHGATLRTLGALNLSQYS